MFVGTDKEYRDASRKTAALLQEFADRLNQLDEIHPSLGAMASGQIVTGLGTLRRRGPRWVVEQ